MINIPKLFFLSHKSMTIGRAAPSISILIKSKYSISRFLDKSSKDQQELSKVLQYL